MQLTVKQLSQDDVYTDAARIPQQYRLDSSGKKIREGRICKVDVGGKAKLLSLRGDLNSVEPTIRIDDITRNDLALEINQTADFKIDEVRWIGQFLWAWRASNPAYRIAARVGLISVLLGLVGLLLGIAGILIAICSR